jgi:hypothetical protein
MGISRVEAEPHCRRHFGDVAMRRPQFPGS